jgi:hypothetical protein
MKILLKISSCVKKLRRREITLCSNQWIIILINDQSKPNNKYWNKNKFKN